MDLLQLLEQDRERIVAVASETLDRSRLPHYAEAGQAVGHDRLDHLFRLMVQAIQTRDLAPVIDDMAAVAIERFAEGYAIREVQIAINVLEEVVWKTIVDNVSPAELAESLGLVTTVLGAAKDSLARTYVSLASQGQTTSSLDLSALFKGA